MDKRWLIDGDVMLLCVQLQQRLIHCYSMHDLFFLDFDS